MREVQAVLFDMGGVIVQLDSLVNVLGPSTLAVDDVWTGWILSEAVQSFERGRCGLDEFAEAIVDELGLVGTPQEFVDRFKRFPMGLYPGAVELVESVPATVTTGVLSNTSALHWDHQADGETVRGLCDHAYLSYEIGLAKPGHEIFDYAVADLGVSADSVLFIDDNQINVDGGIAAGLQAGLAKGPEQAMLVLQEFGVVSPPTLSRR